MLRPMLTFSTFYPFFYLQKLIFLCKEILIVYSIAIEAVYRVLTVQTGRKFNTRLLKRCRIPAADMENYK